MYESQRDETRNGNWRQRVVVHPPQEQHTNKQDDSNNKRI